MTEKNTSNFLRFLQNGNAVLIRNRSEFVRFKAVLKHHNLESLLPIAKHDEWLKLAKLNYRSDKFWNLRSLYAECQNGKEQIGVYAYNGESDEWYGEKPFLVSDIDDREAK